MIALILLAQMASSLGTRPIPDVVGMSGPARIYHLVSLAALVQTTHTHVAVCGTVTHVVRETDGDWHVRLSAGTAFIVAEIIPELPMLVPKTGQEVRVFGISRIDKAHRWAEVHPVLAVAVVRSCAAKVNRKASHPL